MQIARAILPKLHQSVSANITTEKLSVNMDEIGLNYLSHCQLRNLPDQPRTGLKLARDRVTAVLCVNASGTHILLLIIIGKAKRPRCFTLNWNPKRDHGVCYVSNKSNG